MRLEFLEKGSPDCPLIRIYGDPSGFAPLLRAVLQLAGGNRRDCLVHELPGFQSVSGCTLKMISAETSGVSRQGTTQNFEWKLAPQLWETTAGLIEPFAIEPKDGAYQWLSGPEARYGLAVGKIAVLLSASSDGRW